MYASQNFCTELVELLLANDADINAEDEEGNAAIQFAAGRGPLGTVQLLIAQGARLETRNKENMNVMFQACSRGDADVVALLLEHGVEVNLRDETSSPETPLIVTRCGVARWTTRW